MLETVPEESSRTSYPDERSMTPPPNPFSQEDASHDMQTLPSLDYSEELPKFVESTDADGGKSLPPNFEKMANIFHEKQAPGTIDVWWLYDDGGNN